MKRFSRRLLLALVITIPPTMALAGVTSNEYESRLLRATANIVAGQWSVGLKALNALTQDYPDSRVGHLLRSDLLFALAGRARSLPELSNRSSETHAQELREQLRLRWQHAIGIRETKTNRVPAKLVKVSSENAAVLYVDLPAARLHVFRQIHGELQRLADFYVTVGRQGYGKEREGDLKTPVGVYRINGYIPGSQLEARYGSGALTTNYPNPLDQQMRRTGYGIWLHGTEPGWINRGPRASEGCITLSNADFGNLYRLLGTADQLPIIIDDTPDWISPVELQRLRTNLLAIIHGGSQIDSQQQVQPSVTAIAVDITQTSRHDLQEALPKPSDFEFTEIFVYPGPKTQLVTRATKFKGSGKTDIVEQYWVKEDNQQWRIILQQQIPVMTQRKIAAEPESKTAKQVSGA
ncbi:L,D-transpeptidase family protein [Gammaproteobacteria bacterium]|nr:L,D-transpeptidase family protein [Gammaproteobacteria bacterium]